MYKIEKENLEALFRKIAESQDLILPVKKAGQTNFGLWNEGEEADLETLKTVKSGKDAFFPQSETLYTCVRDGKKLTVEPEELRSRPFVVFGMKACDVKGVAVLDKVFLADPVDTYYQARREHGIVVSMACHRPEETCFCSTFGIDATKPEGDVVTWIAEDTLYWEAQTEKGEGLTKKVEAVLAESDSKAVEAQQAAVKEILKKLPLADLDLSYFTSHPELEIFKREEWKELSSHCLGCGTCTFVCPTCQCYDVRDYNTGHGIERYRCWDSCMYRDFTMMAHGTNRKSQVERFRQRFMHKLVYNPLRNDGEFSCVGCGRCLKKCPNSLNIVKVAKTLGGTQA